MASARGLTLPLLDGVQPDYVQAVGEPLAAALASRLLEVGLAYPSTWADAGGSPTVFLERTLDDWQQAAGGHDVGVEYLGVAGMIMSDLRMFFWERAQDAGLERMWIVFEQTGTHEMIEMQHVAALLERAHVRLPATFHQWLVGAVNTVGYAWDAHEAGEWLEMYGDWIIEQYAEAKAYATEHDEEFNDAPWPIEVDVDRGLYLVKDMRLPALQKKPLAESTVRKLLPKLSARTRKIMELVLEMRTLADSLDLAERNHYGMFDELDLHETSHRTPPVVIMPMERYDAIERAWDEENMAMSQMGEPVQPLLTYRFDARDDDDLKLARRVFSTATTIYGLLAELLALLPTRDPGTLAESLEGLEVQS